MCRGWVKGKYVPPGSGLAFLSRLVFPRPNLGTSLQLPISPQRLYADRPTLCWDDDIVHATWRHVGNMNKARVAEAARGIIQVNSPFLAKHKNGEKAIILNPLCGSDEECWSRSFDLRLV